MIVKKKNRLIITNYLNKRVGFFFENGKCEDIAVEPDSGDACIGDIYVGRVKHIVKNIDAFFVEYKKDCMAYMQMSAAKGERPKQGDEIAVCITKTGVKTKKPVVSTNLKITGRYCIIMTEKRKLISGKIKDNETINELGIIANEINEKGYGIIIRTQAADHDEELVREEANKLVELMESNIKKGNYLYPPALIYKAPGEIIRRIYKQEKSYFDEILTDDKEYYESLLANPTLKNENIVFYKDDYPLHKLLSLQTLMEKTLNKNVWLKSGASLVIEPTEALTVIDVNTKKAISGNRNRETTFLKINEEAAREAARQIRLRGITGTIVIDFIEMRRKENVAMVMDVLREEFERDIVPTKVIDVTKLGLVEITRKKEERSLFEIFGYAR